MLLTDDDLTIGRTFDVVVENDLVNAICDDDAAGGILDAADAASDVGFDSRVFKCPVASRVEGAVLQNQVVGITEGLLATDVAVDKPQVSSNES